MSDVVDILFSVNDQTARIARFDMRRTRQTAEGGVVGVGTRGTTSYLVHEPRGRKVESITLAAVATATAHGVIAFDLLVGAFVETGEIDSLAAAVKAAIDERDGTGEQPAPALAEVPAEVPEVEAPAEVPAEVPAEQKQTTTGRRKAA